MPEEKEIYKNPFDDSKISNYLEDKEPELSENVEDKVMASREYIRGFFTSVDSVFSMIASLFKGIFK